MKFTATIDGVALAALIFAVVAIAAVSAVAVISAENLISTNEKALRMQRTVSSLEAIRFHSFAIGSSEQNYIITGKDSELTPYRAGAVEVEAEISYLAARRLEHPDLNDRFDELQESARAFIVDARKIVDTRRLNGEQAATDMVKKHYSDGSREKLLKITYELLAGARKQLDAQETEQMVYGDKVRRLIVALISTAAFILIFLYVSVRRLSIAQRAAQARFAHQAMHDSLTGLRNRAAVMEHIDKKPA